MSTITSGESGSAATLKSVASLAGVSTATVARVLRGSDRVLPETRDRVQAAIEQSNYLPNAIASGLRRQRTDTIGHILHDRGDNPYFSEVAVGLQDEAAQHSVISLAFNARHDVERERIGVEAFLSRRVDAIVFTDALLEENVALALRGGARVVQVGRPAIESLPTVRADDFGGAQEATELLLELGHRRIAYVGIGATRPGDAGDMRLAGYRKAIENSGATASEFTSRPHSRLAFADEGRILTEVALSSDDRPTALFVAADPMAAGALQAAYAWGLRVPDDLSVIGFDDTYAAHLAPSLSTVAVPMRALGRVAFDYAVRENAPPGLTILPTQLTLRSSTAALRTSSAI
jgi:DNA-binding LacI/PurR family transcriptional regulator